LLNGWDCEVDRARALELLKTAADLGSGEAQFSLGRAAYGELDWQRFELWAPLVLRVHGRFPCWLVEFWNAVFGLLPSFEKGESGRILHIAAPVIRVGLRWEEESYGLHDECRNQAKQKRLIELHETMLLRARRAIACWSMVGCRLQVVKDVRVLIAKMVWQEPWRWSAKRDFMTRHQVEHEDDECDSLE
jgi:hypothetical protein